MYHLLPLLVWLQRCFLLLGLRQITKQQRNESHLVAVRHALAACAIVGMVAVCPMVWWIISVVVDNKLLSIMVLL